MQARHACGHPARYEGTACQMPHAHHKPLNLITHLPCFACLLRTADVNECAALPQPCFDANSTCTNTAGSYSCACAVGYTVAFGDAKTAACDGE